MDQVDNTQLISLYEGATCIKRITYTDDSGNPVDLSGCTIRFDVTMDWPETAIVSLSTSTGGVTIDDPANGIATVTISPSDTLGKVAYGTDQDDRATGWWEIEVVDLVGAISKQEGPFTIYRVIR